MALYGFVCLMHMEKNNFSKSSSKVVFLLTDATTKGGVQRVNSIIGNNLSDVYDIHIVSIFSRNTSPSYPYNENISIEYLFKEHFDLRLNFFRYSAKICQIVQKLKPSVIVVSGMGHVPSVILATAFYKCNLIAWEHQHYTFGNFFGLEWFGRRLACAFFNKIVTLTKKDYDTYLRKKGRCKAEVYHIYNPLVSMKTNKSYNPELKSIVSMGSLTTQKGFDFAIKVAKIIFKNNCEWKWHIYGEGIERDALQKEIEANNLMNNVILEGYTNNAYELYNEHSIYCMTSRHEGFPMVLLEATAAHLPIVSFDCPCGPSEIIHDGENGYLIPCFDIKIFADKLNKLMQSPLKRKQFSMNQSSHISEFDLSHIISKWKTILK